MAGGVTNADNGKVDPPATTAQTCTMTLDEHIEVAMAALTMFGGGLACETTYHALLVIADVSRILHGHAEYDPSQKADELVNQVLAMKARLLQEQAERAQPSTEGVFPAPDSGKIH